MKYYIPTSSLNFNNILSTESISPKVFYEKRGFGYSRWFSIEENNIEDVTLLFDSPHMFERPTCELEDHAMLVEISTNDEFVKLFDGVFYTNKTIYLNPWQTHFYFFSDKVKRTVIFLSDSSLETKLVRLYQRQIHVSSFAGKYPVIQEPISVCEDANKYIEEDYIINKMKGLLYGYYIGANLSSSKEQIQKLDSLREIKNIFSSVISSDDRIPSDVQKIRLNELFYFLEQQLPIYLDLKKVVGNQPIVDRILDVFKRYGYIISTCDKDKLIKGLQSEAVPNPSVSWVKREIANAKALTDSAKKLLSPDKAEIIVSSTEKVISLKSVEGELMNSLFKYWMNNVLCSRVFSGKVNSVKETLSDELTKAAKTVIGTDWDTSPVRTYLNQLRRHVRGEEFNQKWDNGLLSSMAAVLLKGDEWEQLLYFMQSKGMYEYRLAYAIYGVLNGFANMTRDFTDLILNKDSYYLSSVYREFLGQLHEREIPTTFISENITEEGVASRSDSHSLISQVPLNTTITQWREDIRAFTATAIKRDKVKLQSSLEDALNQNGEKQDYFSFITMLGNYDGWKPGKKGSWKRLQEHYVPDYDQRISKITKKKHDKKMVVTEKTLFGESQDRFQQVTQTVKSIFAGSESQLREKSILADTTWISYCASQINDSKAKKQFIDDMEWFVGNHNKVYNDKKKGKVTGCYFGKDTSNISVQRRLKTYMEYKLNPRFEKSKWLANIYANIPINKIMDYIFKVYGS